MLCSFCNYDMETDDRYGCPNCNGEGLDMPTTPAERKRRQRELDAKEGIREVTVRVPVERAQEVRELAARLMRERFPGA